MRSVSRCSTTRGLALASAVLVWTAVFGAAPLGAADTADSTRERLRGEIVGLVARAMQPVMALPESGRAWIVEAQGRWSGGSARVSLAWDARGQLALDVQAPGVGSLAVGLTPDGSWLHVPSHGVLFRGKAAAPVQEPALARSRLWEIARTQLGLALPLLGRLSLPNDLRIEKDEAGWYRVFRTGADWGVRFQGGSGDGVLRVGSEGEFEGEASILRLEKVPAESIRPRLAPPDAARCVDVDDDDLRWMVATMVDMLCEKALWSVRPESVPSLFPQNLVVDGHARLVVRGSPEEMGRQYAAAIPDALRSNLHRVLHGIGLIETVRTGKWFPHSLRDTWAVEQKYVPERFLREMDAMAGAIGVRREHVHWTNIFPERFHCSGLALRGKATEGGRLLHGRILDYMTEVGFQASAVITVHAPAEHHAWVNVGYAGCIGTVTAMNARGLAMGEMGGRGEGHIEGVPMTFLMREIVERFETTQEALDYLKSVPRTCEYFYVLSDAKTKSMAGVASWARSLAKERGIEDLLVLAPGESHELLPHGIEDAVLMSADGRYRRLVERVRASYGSITPQKAWEILGEGVAMKSALHIALFQPETLDFWVAEAGLDASPAYTQPVVRWNLGKILAGSSAPAAPAVPAAPAAPETASARE